MKEMSLIQHMMQQRADEMIPTPQKGPVARATRLGDTEWADWRRLTAQQPHQIEQNY